jgi:AAA+ ATPase superfamily predicted ATPase
MRLVTRRVPATESQPEKSKRGLYQIDDHFLRFWFRYVHPNQASLDLGLIDAILDQRVKSNLDSFASITFEEASRDFIGRLARNNRLPFTPERIGGWWERHAEIDVLALNRVEGHALVGECKWSVNPVGVDILDELKSKTRQLNKAGEIANLHYALFARTGFTSVLEKRAKEEGVLLFTVEDIVQSVLK